MPFAIYLNYIGITNLDEALEPIPLEDVLYLLGHLSCVVREYGSNELTKHHYSIEKALKDALQKEG